MEWIRQQRLCEHQKLQETLSECRSSLNKEVKVPLNVSCDGIVKGILTRVASDIKIQGTAEIHGKLRFFDTDFHQIPQISLLMTSLERAVGELQQARPAESLKFLKTAQRLVNIPPREMRFPHKLFEEGAGLCSEIFVCEKSSIVANLHAYQDSPSETYRSTDTASAKTVDPVLMELSQKLTSVCDDLAGLIN